MLSFPLPAVLEQPVTCRNKRLTLSQTAARIKRSPITVAGGTKQKEQIKFKIRAKRHLHTLVLTDNSKAEKIKQSLPPGT